jgi:hypothetical protein
VSQRKVIHCGFDLDWIIHRNGAGQMAGHVRLPGTEGWADEAAIITYATMLKMRGMDAMPTCANHDAKGHCAGCIVESSESAPTGDAP